MSETVARTARAYYAATRVLDIDAIVDLCDENVILRTPVSSPATKGRAAARKFFQTIRDLFAAIGVTEEFVYATDEIAATKWTCNGIAPGGKTVTFEGIDILRISPEGKITEFLGYWDPARMLSVLEG